jgi:hypothetical protein
MDDEEEYRRNEEEARRIAAQQSDAENRALWLKLADWWRHMRQRVAQKR